MEVKGKIVEISQTQQVTDTFKKREFVLEFAENPQYPEFVKFEMIQDKCGLLDNYQTGNEVTISFNLKGRKWNDPKGGVKYFNTLQAWRIQNDVQGQSSQSNTSESNGFEQQTEPDWISDNEETDDLPF